MTRFVVVTGTDTGVGKTVATAALAAYASGRVLVVKPVQTGIGGVDPDQPDVDTVASLAEVDTRQFIALDEPLAPDTAARRQRVSIPYVAEHVARIRDCAAAYDVVFVEGAGGLLVHLDLAGGTLLDLAVELAAEVVIVVRAGLGTLNHAALTAAALRARGIEPAGLIVGSWPSAPSVAEVCNLEDLPAVTGIPVTGVLPEGAGSLDAGEFQRKARVWMAGGVAPDVAVSDVASPASRRTAG